MSQQQYTPNRAPQEEEIDLREELQKYSRYWPAFLGSVLLCMILAFLYLRYTTPVYQTTATIIIKDEKNGGAMSELAAFESLGLLSGMGSNSLENEMGILRSKRLMTDVVKGLKLNVQYFVEGNVRTSEVYENKPVEVQLLMLEEGSMAEARHYKVHETDGETIRLVNEDTGAEVKSKYGHPIDLEFGTIVVARNTEVKSENNFPVTVVFSPVDNVAAAYRQKMQLNLTDKNSSLIELNLQDPVKEKAQDILDQLILEYNRQAIEDKNLVARNTAEFIEDRLDIITRELDSVETGKEEFKESNRLTDIQAESQMFIENVSDFNKRQQEVSTQLELSNAMIEYITSGSGSDLLPANLGISEAGVNAIIAEYNNLVLERDRILSGSTELNPVVVKLNSRIDQIKGNVLASLQRLRSNLMIAKEDLQQQAAAIGSKIATVPGKEKQFRGIERQQNIKEALYLFLLQKREETSLSLAVTAPKAKIVDSAYSSNDPVSPKSKIIILAALILGFVIPFLIIYLKNLFNNKVVSQKDMQAAARIIPIVGEIPKVNKKEEEIIAKNDRSVISEAFRILHTNLQYLLVNVSNQDAGNVLFVTSSVKGEGKTFVAFNLALTLANAGKKVLIMGADLRNPQLQRYETDARDNKGISDYLVNRELLLESLIKRSQLHPNLSLLSSGSIPPNPSELWRQNRADELFENLRSQYDYIVVDTAPVMLVTDTFLINKFADLTLYLVRAGYSEKRLLDFAIDAKNDGKLTDVSFVLNDVKLVNFGYGNKYGYVYGAHKESFWNKIRGKAALW